MDKNAKTVKQPRNLLDLSVAEKREFLETIEQVISDVDGVVWNLSQPIEGAVEGFNALLGVGKKITFMSNNCTRPPQMYEGAFKKINLNVDVKNIVNPTQMIVQYLQSIKFEGLIYVIACEAVKKALRDAGFQVIEGPSEIFKEDLKSFLNTIFDEEPVRAVVMDIDFNLSTMKLLRAQNYLRHPECKFIVGATDNALSVTKDTNVLGPGPFIRILAETAPDKTMVVLGKPGKELGDMLCKYLAVREPSNVLMIGDMLEQDICFGRRNNFRTLAVLSGGCELRDIEQQTDPMLVPDYYCHSMHDFVQFVREANTTKL